MYCCESSILFLKRLSAQARSFLAELDRVAEAAVGEEAQVIVVYAGEVADASNLKKQFRFPFPTLVDESGSIVSRFCQADASLYVTDRFREIFVVRHDELLTKDEILEWLAHINRQCPE